MIVLLAAEIISGETLGSLDLILMLNFVDIFLYVLNSL